MRLVCLTLFCYQEWTKCVHPPIPVSCERFQPLLVHDANDGLTGLAQFLGTVTSGDAHVCPGYCRPAVGLTPPQPVCHPDVCTLFIFIFFYYSAQVVSVWSSYCASPNPQRRAHHVTSICRNTTPF